MLFNSLEFIVFLLAVLILNHLLKPYGKAQKWMLLIASYYFYGRWNWMYLGLIIFSTVLDYAIGLGLIRVKNKRRLLVISVVSNLGLLAFFKYSNFLIENWNQLTIWFNLEALKFSAIDILLPVGISFYTFQSLSYTIDVARGDSPPRKSLLDYALFVAFFPQLVAGPIVRDGEFFQQLDNRLKVDSKVCQLAIVLLTFGFVKKLVLADNLAPFVDQVFSTPELFSAATVLTAVYAFAFQIYGDFSGYTDIAIGAALLLGFQFPKNFDYPYYSLSLQDFWRRWHMTLSRWLRDYLYVSLGGNRKGSLRTYVNLFLTMLLGGLWHGASWNFVIWGAIHGSYLGIERAFFQKMQWFNSSNGLAKLVRWAICFHVVCFAWIFFRADSLSKAFEVLKSISTFKLNFENNADLIFLLVTSVMIVHLVGGKLDTKKKVAESNGMLYPITILAGMLLVLWFAPFSRSPFIYFQF